jgi:hypothetical protein
LLTAINSTEPAVRPADTSAFAMRSEISANAIVMPSIKFGAQNNTHTKKKRVRKRKGADPKACPKTLNVGQLRS